MMLASDSILPTPFGNTRSRCPLGQASFHSRSVWATNLPKGTTLTSMRLGLADLIEPIGPLPDVQLAGLEINVFPADRAQL
jgi:hypothetical protein